jgi:hypothetical protein
METRKEVYVTTGWQVHSSVWVPPTDVYETETSLIVHWCTREHGIIRTAAKGARRPGSVPRRGADL